MPSLKVALAVAAALVAAVPASAVALSDTLGRSTLEQTVVAQGGSEFSYLGLGPGDARVVREDLAAAGGKRDQKRRSLGYFAQLTDFQLADEESPARVELLDQVHAAFSAAWRPQEALIPHTVDASIRQVNALQTSPVEQGNHRRASLGWAVLTGDNADSQQRNEARWVARLLDGGTLDPNSGSSDPADYASCPPGTPGPDEAARYTGVQDHDDYAESGTFYDPDEPAGQFAAWPSYPGLMDRAQQPFEVAGLDVPSYVALGNHDGLVQGNQAANAAFEAVATGCVKAAGPSPSFEDPTRALTDTLLDTTPQNALLVPPDPERAYVTKPEYRALFANGPQDDAHGFAYVDQDELDASNGAASYYDFSPAPGLRFVALDSVASGGIAGVAADGNIDDPQYRWLERVLDEASAAGELIVVVSHHAPVSLTADLPDEAAGPCATGDATTEPNAGCDMDPRDSQPIHLGDDMNALLLRHPNVIAWVAGHSHVNDVAPVKAGDGSHGFWVIRTSAEADWPHQDRLLEIMDNRDGTLSIFGTLIDNSAPATAPAAGTPAAAMSAAELASLARTFGYNDPQKDGSAGGEDEDRNVELLVRDPRPAAAGTHGVKLSVTPARAALGTRARFRMRVTRGGQPVAGAPVRLAGRRARTDRRGRAVVALRPRRMGLLRARARGVAAPVLVVRAR